MTSLIFNRSCSASEEGKRGESLAPCSTQLSALIEMALSLVKVEERAKEVSLVEGLTASKPRGKV
jgi:hypothetical protein